MKSTAIVFVVCILLFSFSAVSNLLSTDNTGKYLYRVTVSSHSDAVKLANMEADIFMPVSDGYLVLGGRNTHDLLIESGIDCQLIYADVDRGNLMTVTERSPENIDPFPLIFDEGGLRLYYVRSGLSEEAKDSYGLRQPSTDNLEVEYRESAYPNADFPTSISTDSLIGLISQDSLESYLNHIEAIGHRWWGTLGNTQCRIWIYNKLRDFGYDSVYYDEFTGFGLEYAEGRNVVAVKPGTVYPAIHIIICAHFDNGDASYGYCPGADDNGSGVGAVLEMARIMADIDTRLTYVFIFFDAEEAFMVGSEHYADQAAADRQKIACVINHDMIAHEENDADANAYYYGNDAYAQLWAQMASTLPGVGITAHLSTANGLLSDQGPFAENGYDVLWAEEYILSTHYHTASDSVIYLDFDYMTRIVRASMATAYVADQQFEPEYELHITEAEDFPELIYPNRVTPVYTYIREYGGAAILPGTALLHYSVSGGVETSVEMSEAGGGLFVGYLPSLSCSENISYYISAEDAALGVVYYPGAEEDFPASVGSGMGTVFYDDIEDDLGWTVELDGDHGEWVRVQGGKDYNNIAGYYYRFSDADFPLRNGVTRLYSPPIEIGGRDCLIEYARWFFCFTCGPTDPQTDTFTVLLSSDNSNWVAAESIGPKMIRDWEKAGFRVGDYLPPSDTIWVRFDVAESGGGAIIGGMDAFEVKCPSSDLKVITEDAPNWTAGYPYEVQFEAAVCNEDTLSWDDRFDQLAGTGLTMYTDGLLSGIPTRVGPVLFRALVEDQSGGYDEKIIDFIIYDELEIATVAIPTATIGELYSCQLRSSGGTGSKTWSDRDGDLAGCGIELASDGLLSGTAPYEGDYPFAARVIDNVGAFFDRQYLLHIIGPYSCGDANGDGQVNVGDAVFLIAFVFSGGPAPGPLEAGDANCSSEVDVGDAVYVINFVFKGGAAPCCP